MPRSTEKGKKDSGHAGRDITNLLLTYIKAVFNIKSLILINI